MVGLRDIVITGIGCVSPLGIGRQAFRRALLAEQCAIRPQIILSDSERTTYYAASVDDFDGKQYVTPRKALKVMGREIQMAYSAAHLAWQDAGLTDVSPDPQRTLPRIRHGPDRRNLGTAALKPAAGQAPALAATSDWR